MDNVLVVSIVTLVGALMGTIIPYAIKVWKDPDVLFDMNYAYALGLSVLVQIVGLLPDSVPELNFKVLLMAFASGYGLQTIINKAVPRSS